MCLIYITLISITPNFPVLPCMRAYSSIFILIESLFFHFTQCKSLFFYILNEDRLMYNLDLTDIGKFESTVIGEVLVAIFNEQYHHCYKIMNIIGLY